MPSTSQTCRAALAALTALLAACDGSIVAAPPGPEGTPDPPSGPTPDPLPAFTCDVQPEPVSVPLRRLSRQQYLNTVRDLVTRAEPGNAAAILGALQGGLDQFPADTRTGVTG